MRSRSWHRRPATLRGRLALIALIVGAIWVAVLTVLFNVVLASRLRVQADDLVRTRAAAVASTVEAGPDGAIVVHEPADDRVLDTGVWIFQGDRLVEQPPGSTGLQDRAERLVGRGAVFAQTGGRSPTRLYALPIMDAAGGTRQVGTVVASVGLDPYRSTAHEVLAGSIALALLLLGGLYLVTRAVVGRALRPVAVMSAQAARRSAAGASERFGTAGRPAELATLAGNLDELLDRLAAVLRHEQQQNAELSHELRTPLARITAETEWLTARPRDAAERRTAHEAIAVAAATMERICETLLSEARTRTAAVPGSCRPAEVARELAHRAAAEHPQAAPISVVGGDPTAGVSARMTERILAPLLDNARRYASAAIVVECAVVPGGVAVSVHDDGPGVPDAFAPLVFDPGRRADPQDGHDGAGLGLPLARRLARAANGEIELAASDRGARFVVTLPAG